MSKVSAIVALAACVSLWTPLPTASQTASGVSDPALVSGGLPAVTITATGYASEAAQTPASTTTLEREALDRRQPRNVGDALRGEPGLAVASDSAQGQNPVIRGLKRDSVVLLVDGMRLNSAQPAGAIASFMSVDLAEGIEVVKGASSVLYGTGALGGVVNVRLPQARFDSGTRFRTRLGLDSASRGRRATGVMNFSDGDHALMLGASYVKVDDYRSAEGRVPRTGYDSTAFIGQYRYRIDASQQLRLSAQRHQDEGVWYPASTRPHPHPLLRSLTTHSPKQTRSLYELGYERRDSGKRPLNLDLRVYRQQMLRRIDAHANGLARDIVTNRVSFDTDGADARADWLAHPQHLLSAGLNVWQMRASPDAGMARPPDFQRFSPSMPFVDGRLSAVGVYLQDDMQFDALRVLVGVRHDVVRGRAAAMDNGARTADLDRRDSATSANLGLIYQITPLLRPYASVSRAFRAADLRERYQSGLRHDGFYYAGSPQIAPEAATQIELGLKGSRQGLDYSLAAYRNRIDDHITGVQLHGAAAISACGAQNASACKQTINLGRATLTGLEAGLRWEFRAGQWLALGYSRVRGVNDDLDEPLFQMPADELSIGWQGWVSAAWTLDANVRLVRAQERVATRFTGGAEDATAGYGLLDLGANWRHAKNQVLRIAIHNVTDKRYHEHLSEGLSGQEILAAGRSVIVAWNAEF